MAAFISDNFIRLQRAVDTCDEDSGQYYSDSIWETVTNSYDIALFKESLRYILSMQNPPEYLLNLKWRYLSFVCSFDLSDYVRSEPEHVQKFVQLGHACSKFSIAPANVNTGLRCMRIYKASTHMNKSLDPAILSMTQRLEVWDAGIQQDGLTRISELYGKSVVELEFSKYPNNIISLQGCYFQAGIKVTGLFKPWDA